MWGAVRPMSPKTMAQSPARGAIRTRRTARNQPRVWCHRRMCHHRVKFHPTPPRAREHTKTLILPRRERERERGREGESKIASMAHARGCGLGESPPRGSEAGGLHNPEAGDDPEVGDT